MCWYFHQDALKKAENFVEKIIDFLDIKVCWCSDSGDQHERRVPDADTPGATKHSLEGVIEVKGMEAMDEVAKR